MTEGRPGGGWPADDQDDPPTRRLPAVPPAPIHATPMRIEPQQARPSQGPPPQVRTEPAPESVKPKRPHKRKMLVVAVVVLLLLAAGGVGLALPDVANRLALPWAPNAPNGPEPVPVAVEQRLRGPEDSAPSPTKDGVAAALREAVSSSKLGSLSGSVVDPASGDVLWARDDDRPLPPASTTKLLTAAAALLSIEHTSTLTTTVVRGSEPGSVVLVGGGDTTLSSLPKGKDSVYPGAALLDDLVSQVRKATGGEVDTVHLDLGAFQGDTRGPGWAPEDAPSTYAAPVEAAMLDGGRRNPAAGDSPRTGEPAKALVAEFAKRLGASVGELGATADQDGEVLGEVHSAPLTSLVDTMLTDSDNVLAEAVARQVAIAGGEEPSFSGGTEAILAALRDGGFDLDGVELADGSGLSTDNKIPARLLTELLAAAAGNDDDGRTEKLRPLLGGLPVAGGSGTLAGRYDGAAKPARGWVRAKTGTLSDVNTLAGVVLDSDGKVLVFALMSSGTSPAQARPALDAIAAALRGCGCG